MNASYYLHRAPAFKAAEENSTSMIRGREREEGQLRDDIIEGYQETARERRDRGRDKEGKERQNKERNVNLRKTENHPRNLQKEKLPTHPNTGTLTDLATIKSCTIFIIHSSICTSLTVHLYETITGMYGDGGHVSVLREHGYEVVTRDGSSVNVPDKDTSPSKVIFGSLSIITNTVNLPITPREIRTPKKKYSSRF